MDGWIYPLRRFVVGINIAHWYKQGDRLASICMNLGAESFPLRTTFLHLSSLLRFACLACRMLCNVLQWWEDDLEETQPALVEITEKETCFRVSAYGEEPGPRKARYKIFDLDLRTVEGKSRSKSRVFYCANAESLDRPCPWSSLPVSPTIWGNRECGRGSPKDRCMVAWMHDTTCLQQCSCQTPPIQAGA